MDKVTRFGGHRCKRCGTRFVGLTSKQRAEACFDLGEPRHKYEIGAKVIITQGTRKGSRVYEIKGMGIKRRVASSGKGLRAYHVRVYYLTGVDGKPLLPISWVYEYKLKMHRE